jgi:hypothetical protein
MRKQAIVLAVLMGGFLIAALSFDLPMPVVFGITIAPAILVTYYCMFLNKRRLKAYYYGCPALYRAWLARYGEERKDDIKRFLRVYAGAFGIDKEMIHKIGPDDGVMDYYHRDYAFGEADAMEDVTFATALRIEFGYVVAKPDGKITLGALFEKVTKHA